MNDEIRIEGIEVSAVIGVHGWEREWKRPLSVDLALGLDVEPAAASDQLRDTVDYSAVVERLLAFAASQRFALLETFAERLARELFREFPIQTMRLAVSKPGAVPGVRAISVHLSRRREDYAACGR